MADIPLGGLGGPSLAGTVAGLAEVLEARKGDILQRWELRRQGAFTPGGMSCSELRDRLPWFLDALVMDLRGAREPPSQPHGRQRLRGGCDLESVVREYGLLRDILLELTEEQGWPLLPGELRRLSGFIDRGLAEAVGRHSRAHEQALQAGDGRLPEDLQAARTARVEAERDEARERHASEEAVRQSEMRYRLATLATSDVIWDWDFTTDTIHWSENLYRVFGYGPGELDTGLEWWTERLHPEDRERVGRAIHAAIDGTGTYWRDEYRLLRQDGTWASVEDQGSLVRDARGRAVRMVGAIHDVSERKAAEAEARRRADFEQYLIGIVSHDLRNPISAIITSAATLLKRDGVDERLGRALARILSSAERCNRMLRDVLDFTQARLGGGIPVVRKPVDLHVFARLVLDEVQLAWPARRLERVQAGDARGEWDADRLAQILTNLVNNALSYSPEGSPVRVETLGEADAVVLSVHNEGPAIPPEQVPRLFQPMKRGERGGATQGNGLGLGLFIVKHLVDAHGGSLEVRSVEGDGTTFTVRLPRRPASPPAPKSR